MKKVRKMLVLLALVGVIAAFGIQSAGAQVWTQATINSAGQASGTAFIMMSDAATPSTWGPFWFYVDPAGSNQMLATALTAVSLGKTCTANVDAIASLSTIRTLTVNQ